MMPVFRYINALPRWLQPRRLNSTSTRRRNSRWNALSPLNFNNRPLAPDGSATRSRRFDALRIMARRRELKTLILLAHARVEHSTCRPRFGIFREGVGGMIAGMRERLICAIPRSPSRTVTADGNGSNFARSHYDRRC